MGQKMGGLQPGRNVHASVAMSKACCLLLVIAAAGLQAMYGASKARLLWELRFSAIWVGGTARSKDLQARELAYSPDGNWIAALIGPSWSKLGSEDDLVLIPAGGRTDRIRRIHLGQFAADSFLCKDLFWSPDSGYVAVRLSVSSFVSSFSVFGAADGKPIYRGRVGDEFLGFVDDRRFLVRPGITGVNREGTKLQDRSIFVFDLDGTRPTEWPLSGTIRVGVLGLREIAGVEVQGEKSLVLVNASTGKVLRRDPLPDDLPRVQFGDDGRAYCLGRWPTQIPPRPISALGVRCVDALTGRESRPIGPVRYGEPFDVARDVPVLAATDTYSHLIFHAFDETDIGVNVVSVGVWNLRRGVEVVRHWDRAARLALGPQGDRLAIAADDVLSLYEIPTE